MSANRPVDLFGEENELKADGLSEQEISEEMHRRAFYDPVFPDDCDDWEYDNGQDEDEEYPCPYCGGTGFTRCTPVTTECPECQGTGVEY
jgi:RecJ-like exonuclease